MESVLGVVGTITRLKPLHKGHEFTLKNLCRRAKYVYIGLGSSNEYDAKNPFTVQESREMADWVLKGEFSNYSFVEVPDLHNGPKWRVLVLSLFGKLDAFVTDNDYVQLLLKDDYKIIAPELLKVEGHPLRLSASMVREAMAKGMPWEEWVPEQVVKYLKEKGLVARFVKEFGSE